MSTRRRRQLDVHFLRRSICFCTVSFHVLRTARWAGSRPAQIGYRAGVDKGVEDSLHIFWRKGLLSWLEVLLTGEQIWLYCEKPPTHSFLRSGGTFTTIALRALQTILQLVRVTAMDGRSHSDTHHKSELDRSRPSPGRENRRRRTRSEKGEKRIDSLPPPEEVDIVREGRNNRYT
jgi:hypothetical protein